MKYVYAIEVSKTELGRPNAPSDGIWWIDSLYETRAKAQKILDRWHPSEWEHYQIRRVPVR
jgi:hypothetical protein